MTLIHVMLLEFHSFLHLNKRTWPLIIAQTHQTVFGVYETCIQRSSTKLRVAQQEFWPSLPGRAAPARPSLDLSCLPLSKSFQSFSITSSGGSDLAALKAPLFRKVTFVWEFLFLSMIPSWSDLLQRRRRES